MCMGGEGGGRMKGGERKGGMVEGEGTSSYSLIFQVTSFMSIAMDQLEGGERVHTL